MVDNTPKDLARQKRNEYHRKWQKQNPQKVKQAQDRYWEKQGQEQQNKN